MHSWDKHIVVFATLLAGCQGHLEGPNGGSGAASGIGAPGASGGAWPGTASQGNPGVCVPGVPGTSQLPRLTRAQYDNTIRDLLGLQTQPSSLLASPTR